MAVDKDAAKNVLIARTNVRFLAIQAKNVPSFCVKLRCVCSASVATDGFKLFANQLRTDLR
jgi:hypothetical protein